MTTIPLDDVRFHPHSFADPAGRLFWWNGGLYRGLRSDASELFSGLLREGTLQRLAEQGLLIDSEATHFHLDGYETVVRHRVVPFPSYPEEWCPAMLKDAALTVLELLDELACRGLTLKDSHPWNLLFDRGRAVYVDLTSITPIHDDRWRGYDEFRRFYLNPLMLMACGHERIARRLLLEFDGVRESEVLALTRNSRARFRLNEYGQRLRRLICRSRARLKTNSRSDKAKQVSAADSLIAQFHKARRDIQSIDLPGADAANQIEDWTSSTTEQDARTPTQCRILELFSELKPQSVLDVGSDDNGWYCRAAAAHGCAALAMSTDSFLLTRLYREAHRGRMALLPVVLDFTDPTPSRGLCSHWSAAARERLSCELVVALTSVHRFIFERSLNFEQIVEGLASFSRRWLITEFVPPDDAVGDHKPIQHSSGYQLDYFIAALRRRFKRVTPLPSGPSGRVLLTCEK